MYTSDIMKKLAACLAILLVLSSTLPKPLMALDLSTSSTLELVTDEEVLEIAVYDFDELNEALQTTTSQALVIRIMDDIVFQHDMELDTELEDITIVGHKGESGEKPVVGTGDFSFTLRGENIVLSNIVLEGYSYEGLKVDGGNDIAIENVELRGDVHKGSLRGIAITNHAQKVVLSHIKSSNHMQQGILIEEGSNVHFGPGMEHLGDVSSMTIIDEEKPCTVTGWEDHYTLAFTAQHTSLTGHTDKVVHNYVTKGQTQFDVTTFAELENFSKIPHATLNIKNDITFEKSLYIETDGLTLVGSTSGEKPKLILDSHVLALRGSDMVLQGLEVTRYENNIGIRVQNAERIHIEDVVLNSGEPVGIVNPLTGIPIDEAGEAVYTGNIGILVENSIDITLQQLDMRNHRNAGIQLRGGSRIILGESNVHRNDKVAIQLMDEPDKGIYNEVKTQRTGIVDTDAIANGVLTHTIFESNNTMSKQYYEQKAYDAWSNNEPISVVEYVIYQKVVVSNATDLIQALKIPNSYIILNASIDLFKSMDIMSNNIVLDGIDKDSITLNIGENKFPIIKNKNFILQNIRIDQSNSSEALSVYGARNTTLKDIIIRNSDETRNNAGLDIAAGASGIVVDTIESIGHRQQGVRVRGDSDVVFKGQQIHTNDTIHLQVEKGSRVDIEESNYHQDPITSENHVTYSVYQDIVVHTFKELQEAITYDKRRIIIADDIVFEEALEIRTKGMTLIGQKGYVEGEKLVYQADNRPILDLQGYAFSIREDDQAMHNIEIRGYARNLEDTENRIGLYVYNVERIHLADMVFRTTFVQDPDSEDEVPKNGNKAVGLDIVGSTNVTLQNIHTHNHAYQGIRIRDINGATSQVVLKGGNTHNLDQYAIQMVMSKNNEAYKSTIEQVKEQYTEGEYVVEGALDDPDARVSITYYNKQTVQVYTEEEFVDAVQNKGTVIELQNDIQITGDTKLTLIDGMILEGNGYSIDLGGSGSIETKGRDILIKDVTIYNAKEYGLHAYNSYNVVLDSVILKENPRQGLFVNGSKVEVKGDTVFQDNKDGGIWITRSRTLFLESQRDSHVTLIGDITFKERNINIKVTNLEMVIESENGNLPHMQNNQILFLNEANSRVDENNNFDKYINRTEEKGISEATANILIDRGVLLESQRYDLFEEVTTDYMNKRIQIDVTNRKDLEELLVIDGRQDLGLEVSQLLLKGDGVFDNTNNLKNILEIASRIGVELFFPEGVYVITEDIVLDEISPSAFSNVKLVSDVNAPAIIDGTRFLEGKEEAEKRMLKIKDASYHHPLNYFVVENLIFNNVGFEINGPHKKGVEMIENGFVNGEFVRTMNTDGSKIWRIKMEPYIEVKNSQYLIEGNVMMRSEAHPGKGIATYATKYTEIKGNYIGDLGNLEHAKPMLSVDTYTLAKTMDSYRTQATKDKEVPTTINLETYYEDFITQPIKDAPDGNFFTGINIFRYDKDVVIEGNYLNMTQTRDMITQIGYDVLIEGLGTTERRRDHLIYGKGYDGLTIVGNYFEGMSNDAAGGVKIRNGDNTYVGANYFNNVPLLTYIYPDLTKAETKLHDVLIYNNIFHQKNNFGGEGTGILYYQSFRDGDDLTFRTPVDAPPEDLVWYDSYGDVENFIISNNQFLSDARDRITVSGRVTVKKDAFSAHNNTYIGSNEKVNYNTAGNHGVPEFTKAEIEAQIEASEINELYVQYKDEAIPYNPPRVDTLYLRDLLEQAERLETAIIEQGLIGDTTDSFTVESVTALQDMNKAVHGLLLQLSIEQADVNVALTALDDVLQALEIGTKAPEEDKPSEDDTKPEEDKPSEDDTKPEEDEPSEDDTKPDEDKPSEDDTKPEEDKPSLGGTIPDSGTSDDGSTEYPTLDEEVKPEEDILVPLDKLFVDEAYIKGYEDCTIKPNENTTRAEVVVMLNNVLGKSMDYQNDFTDVQSESWYYDGVNNLVGLGILKGYPDYTFRGNTYITRAEFVTLVNRMQDEVLEGIAEQSYSDVEEAHWAQQEILISAQNGYVVGYEDGTFRPDEPITRAEAITILNRALGRVPDKHFLDSHIAYKVMWQDLNSNHWAYYEILEATVSHLYRRTEDGQEVWLEVYSSY